MTKRYSFFLIFIFLVHFNSKAQQNNYFFDLTGGSGRLVPHHPEIKPLAGAVSFFNLKFGIKTMGQKEWQRVFNYPEIGVGLSHNYLTSKSLGNPTAFYSFMNLPLSPSAKFKINLGINIGIAWGFNPSSPENQINVAIGSKCDAYASLNLNTKFRIGKNFDLLLLAGGYHYSNGNMNKPNKGLNLLGAEAGVRYSIQKSATERNVEPVVPIQKSSSILVFGAYGWKKEVTYATGFPVGSLSVGYYRTISHKSRWSTGIDFFLDEGALYYTQKENTLNNKLAYGIFGGHELTISELSIVTQIGLYLRNPNPRDPFYYERLGLRYTIAKRIIPSLTLKAHEFKVDFVEWGLGFVLWKT